MGRMLDRRSGRDLHFSAIETNTNKVMQEVYGTIIYRSDILFLAAIYIGRGFGSVITSSPLHHAGNLSQPSTSVTLYSNLTRKHKWREVMRFGSLRTSIPWGGEPKIWIHIIHNPLPVIKRGSRIQSWKCSWTPRCANKQNQCRSISQSSSISSISSLGCHKQQAFTLPCQTARP